MQGKVTAGSGCFSDHWPGLTPYCIIPDIYARHVARNVFCVDRAITRRMKRGGLCFTSSGRGAVLLLLCWAWKRFLGVGSGAWCVVVVCCGSVGYRGKSTREMGFDHTKS